MDRVLRRSRYLLLALSLVLAGCESSTSPHRLPAYEAPLARAEFQTVRTTAYTDTEADHLVYTNHNALGGILHAASLPLSPGVMVAAAGPVRHVADDAADDLGGLRQVSNDVSRARPVAEARTVSPARSPSPPPAARAASGTGTAPAARPSSDGNPPWMAEYLKRKRQQQQESTRPSFYITPPAAVSYSPPVVYGSAAADWSRWPVGTVFRIQSTGQIYKVDDYGWALAGRNTIDLYHATKADMNAWGVRREPIRVLQWGSREESLRLLRNHQGYKHIRRMVMEIESRDSEAAALE